MTLLYWLGSLSFLRGGLQDFLAFERQEIDVHRDWGVAPGGPDRVHLGT